MQSSKISKTGTPQMTKRPVVWKQCYGLQGTRSREWGSPWGGTVERDRHCVKLSSGAGQGAFHVTLTGTVVQRGVTLTPLPLMTSFRQWPIGEQRRGQWAQKTLLSAHLTGRKGTYREVTLKQLRDTLEDTSRQKAFSGLLSLLSSSSSRHRDSELLSPSHSSRLFLHFPSASLCAAVGSPDGGHLT